MAAWHYWYGKDKRLDLKPVDYPYTQSEALILNNDARRMFGGLQSGSLHRACWIYQLALLEFYT
eukprot:12893815-Prorocentrum_lima.AAC.1